MGIREMLPRGYRSYISEGIEEEISKIGENREVIEGIFRDNIELMRDYCGGDVKQYLSGVKYCAYRLLGISRCESWCRVFPEREARCRGKGGSEEEIRKRIKNNADAYNGTKLISEIMGRSLVPSWIINAPYYQEGIEKLVEIIRDDSVRNGMVKVKACEALIAATKRPEVVEQRVEIKGGDGIGEGMLDELRKVTEELADKIREGIRMDGKVLKEVTEMELSKCEDGSYE